VLAAYNYRGRDTELPGGVLRFDATTGQLVDSLLNNLPAFGAASGGQLGLAFGPDGDLYVGSPRAKAVLRFDVASHAKIGEYFTPGPSHSAEFIVFLPVNVPEPATIVLALFSASCLLIAQPRRRMNALR
jgi:hypothetical protein